MFGNFLLIIFYVYECFVCLYVCTPHGCSAHGGQKKVTDHLELQMVVNHHVGAEN